MHVEDDSYHFRHGYVGVILYPHSQAEDIIGNCVIPVMEVFIFAYIRVSLSNEDLSVVTYGVIIWQIAELTSLGKRNIKSVCN